MPAIGEIVEEVLGINRKAINAVINEVSTFKNFICAGFGVSKESHRESTKNPLELAKAAWYQAQSAETNLL